VLGRSGARAWAAAVRARQDDSRFSLRVSQRPFTMLIFRALHLRPAARTLVFRYADAIAYLTPTTSLRHNYANCLVLNGT